ncbi:hypothetical protein [Aquimarina sp. RZ0]|uniref:hypothetical protein n=1 Tax=Aquimarina sp. RZ0 TaxID=2607730 RepID=UPI0011F1BCC1|nr:hypothetical protein [Aquimarina sp. RZ0]KAA1242468.1 hypothetical protein F0000_25450 [Aquimarina sp. RZ0]
MYTNPESLKEVHELIREALQSAGKEAGSSISPAAQAQKVAFHFRTAIDNTRTQLSEALYKVDLAMQGHDTAATRASYEMQDLYGNTDPRTMSDAELTERYIQETADGYKVYDSRYDIWITMSASSEISIEMMISPELGGDPIARIRAYDPESGSRVEYEDWEITQKDIRSSYLNEWDAVPPEWREMHYQDALYGMAKTGIGGAGKVSGATSSFMMANHYRASNNLFAGNFSNYYKGWTGEWAPIRNVPGLDTPRTYGKWTRDIDEITAKSKGKMAGAKWKKGGRICFFITVLFSINDIRNAKKYNDSNYSELKNKKYIDIAFGLTGFIPGVGWAISGTYFLLDVGGAFGNWGQASGFSRETVDGWIARDRAAIQEELCTMDFEIDYIKPIEETRMEMLRESREFARDNTYVTPRAIYSTKRF